ncbi:uncharacterized protein [Typha angustifolia]|uniref:uncharacterized protein isoform X1 n=2 Tax=Typha angustifolia TaxID=59011 RepID=UPI003C30192B
MPCDHGRTGSNVEMVADRRKRLMLKRSLYQNNKQFLSKGNQIRELGSRNSEQRCVIFTFFALDPDARWKLVPFLPPLQGANARNRLTSGGDMDGLESLSPQSTIIFHFDLPDEQKASLFQNTEPAKMFLNCCSFGGRIGQSQESKNWTKPVKSSSSTSISSFLVTDNSSAVCDNSTAVGSDFLVNSVPKAGKTVKRSPRKKGKKKGKQYRRTAFRKDSAGLETQCEESTDGTSTFEISDSSHLTCSPEHAINKFSEEESSPRPLVKDSSVEKADCQDIGEQIDSNLFFSCTSYSDEMDESEPTTSSQGEQSSCNNAHYLDNAPPAIQAPVDDWKSVISGSCSDDTETQLLVRSDSGDNPLECGMVTDSKNYHTPTVNIHDSHTDVSSDCFVGSAHLSKDVSDIYDGPERAQCSNEACSSNDFHPVISGKRGRRNRRTSGSGSSNGSNRFNSGSIHGHTEKDNGHSYWQKVQKDDVEECIHKSRNVIVTSPQDENALKESKARVRSNPSVRLKQSQSGKTCKISSSDEVVNSRNAANTKFDSYEIPPKSITRCQINDVKTKSSSASKQAAHQSRKGSYTAKNNITRASKNHVLQKEALQILPSVSHPRHPSNELLSPSSQNFLFKPTNNADNNQSEVKHKAQNDSQKTADEFCSVGYDLSTHSACYEPGRLTAEQDSYGHTDVRTKSACSNFEDANYGQGDLFLTEIEDNQCMKLETKALTECSRLDSSAGPKMQRWIPIGKKDSLVSDMGHFDSLQSSIDHSFHDNLIPNNEELEGLGSNTPYVLPSTGSGLLISGLSSESVHMSLPADAESDINVKTQTFPAKLFDSVPAVSESRTATVKDYDSIGSETDLNKITEAVNDAYKVQIEVECLKLVTGCWIADFERFLYSASPVIGHSLCTKSCNICLPEELIGDSLCSHQIPNISLKSIWQWYEEPGCYGLEVKAQDYSNLKRMQNRRSEFTSYFVPYLSAVQLFGQSKSTSCNIINGEVGVDKASNTSPLPSLPILSILLPKPFKQKDANLLELSSSVRDDKLVRRGDGELLFEYFETEQPPWRRPLYEKIKQLVSCVKSSNSQIFGDPNNLEAKNLHDLHPASWFSVAWYPICRIPDGNFRAAFLTYHSLGNLVHRGGSLDMAGGLAPIVSPVIGLQSYNDKGEWWFHLKDSYFKSVPSEDTPYSNPSKILKERLRTLQRTASVMSRAVISKGNQRSANQHGDYEFFLSRSR